MIVIVAIEVDEKDAGKVFGILLGNGRFTGLSKTSFRIDEHSDEVLEKLKQEKINIRIIN